MDRIGNRVSVRNKLDNDVLRYKGVLDFYITDMDEYTYSSCFG